MLNNNKGLNIQQRFFNFIDLQYSNLTEQINNWLISLYNKSEIQLDESSPYGQILTAIKEVFIHNILYLKNIVDQLNIETTDDTRILRNLSRISGHNPSRPISASGVLKFKLKGEVNIQDEFGVSNPKIIIPDKAKLKNKSNNLEYVINLGASDSQAISIDSNSEFYVNVLQGKYETQTFTSDGSSHQSFSVNTNEAIENFNFNIYYNGRKLRVVEHFYDMLPDEYACVTRTGFNGGLDIYFGNGDFGIIPEPGTIITAEYLLTDGVEGEILNPQENDWKIESDITDSNGETVDLEDLFDISVEINVNFASNGESSEMTKNIIPKVSRNFVLATPEQFKYHLLKLNMFSQVDAFNKLDDNNFSELNITQKLQKEVSNLKRDINQDKSQENIINKIENIQYDLSSLQHNTNDNVIFLFLIPKVSKYINSNTNYFNLPLDVFRLDEIEKQKTINYLKAQGILSITTEIKIIQPTISRYICNINASIYQGYLEENIRNNIISELSDFFINNTRTDRIVRADIIRLLKENIDGIDSIDVNFISKKNEDHYKKFGEAIIDENSGIDRYLGDIVVKKEEYPLIRGGWTDRSGNYYNDNITQNTNKLSSLNINFDNKKIKR